MINRLNTEQLYFGSCAIFCIQHISMADFICKYIRVHLSTWWQGTRYIKLQIIFKVKVIHSAIFRTIYKYPSIFRANNQECISIKTN